MCHRPCRALDPCQPGLQLGRTSDRAARRGRGLSHGGLGSPSSGCPTHASVSSMVSLSCAECRLQQAWGWPAGGGIYILPCCAECGERRRRRRRRWACMRVGWPVRPHRIRTSIRMPLGKRTDCGDSRYAGLDVGAFACDIVETLQVRLLAIGSCGTSPARLQARWSPPPCRRRPPPPLPPAACGHAAHCVLRLARRRQHAP